MYNGPMIIQKTIFILQFSSVDASSINTGFAGLFINLFIRYDLWSRNCNCIEVIHSKILHQEKKRICIKSS